MLRALAILVALTASAFGASSPGVLTVIVGPPIVFSPGATVQVACNAASGTVMATMPALGGGGHYSISSVTNANADSLLVAPSPADFAIQDTSVIVGPSGVSPADCDQVWNLNIAPSVGPPGTLKVIIGSAVVFSPSPTVQVPCTATPGSVLATMPATGGDGKSRSFAIMSTANTNAKAPAPAAADLAIQNNTVIVGPSGIAAADCGQMIDLKITLSPAP